MFYLAQLKHTIRQKKDRQDIGYQTKLLGVIFFKQDKLDVTWLNSIGGRSGPLSTPDVRTSENTIVIIMIRD